MTDGAVIAITTAVAGVVTAAITAATSVILKRLDTNKNEAIQARAVEHADVTGKLDDIHAAVNSGAVKVAGQVARMTGDHPTIP
jgi:ribose 1,5-bisphosphokinase PhnN